MSGNKMGYSVAPSIVAGILPSWLEIEKEYANSKHGSANRQTTASSGGLQPGNLAYIDFANYYGRAMFFIDNADGDEHILLKASQSLGKFVGVGGALLRAGFQIAHGLGVDEADNKAIDVIEDGCVVSGNTDFPDIKSFGEDTLYPSLAMIDRALSENELAVALDKSKELVIAQAGLFIGFTSITGVIATPGINSSDPGDQLDNWYV